MNEPSDEPYPIEVGEGYADDPARLLAAAYRAAGLTDEAIAAARSRDRDALAVLAASPVEPVTTARTSIQRDEATRISHWASTRAALFPVVALAAWLLLQFVVTSSPPSALSVLLWVVWGGGIAASLGLFAWSAFGARWYVRVFAWPRIVARAARWIRFEVERPEEHRAAVQRLGAVDHDHEVELLARLRTRDPVDSTSAVLAGYVAAFTADPELRDDCGKAIHQADAVTDPNTRLMVTTITMLLFARDRRLKRVHRMMLVPVDRAMFKALLLGAAVVALAGIAVAILNPTIGRAVGAGAAIAVLIGAGLSLYSWLYPPQPDHADLYLIAAYDRTRPTHLDRPE